MGSRLSESPRPEHRQPFELTLGREAIDRLQTTPTTVGAKDPREEIVAPGDLEGFEELLLERAILNRHLDLDATVEVAFHEIG